MHNTVKAIYIYIYIYIYSQSPMYAWTMGSRIPTIAKPNYRGANIVRQLCMTMASVEASFCDCEFTHPVPSHHTWGLARNEILNSSYFLCQAHFLIHPLQQSGLQH